jgi:hypothetical protein
LLDKTNGRNRADWKLAGGEIGQRRGPSDGLHSDYPTMPVQAPATCAGKRTVPWYRFGDFTGDAAGIP